MSQKHDARASFLIDYKTQVCDSQQSPGAGVI